MQQLGMENGLQGLPNYSFFDHDVLLGFSQKTEGSSQ